MNIKKIDEIVLGWNRIEQGIIKSDRESCKEKTLRTSRQGRELLKSLVFQEYAIVIEDDDIGKGPMGKPYLLQYPHIHFNISHSGDYVACAVGKEPLGLDIQIHLDRDCRRTARRIMNPAEWSAYEASGFQNEYFYQCWTRKESYLKYTGEGITRDLRLLEEPETAHVQYLPLNLWPGYSACLCLPKESSSTL